MCVSSERARSVVMQESQSLLCTIGDDETDDKQNRE